MVYYHSALEDYNKVLKSNSKNSVAYLIRVDIKSVYKDHIEAIYDLSNALNTINSILKFYRREVLSK